MSSHSDSFSKIKRKGSKIFAKPLGFAKKKSSDRAAQDRSDDTSQSNSSSPHHSPHQESNNNNNNNNNVDESKSIVINLCRKKTYFCLLNISILLFKFIE
jgi:hypothetical protein